jgi:hypothetical protein
MHPVDRLITSKDHASVQISIADVDANGRAMNTSTTFALCGQVRSQGESDDSVNRLATKAGCKFYTHSFWSVAVECTLHQCSGTYGRTKNDRVSYGFLYHLQQISFCSA